MIWLALIVTVVVISLIVWAWNWILRHKQTHPELYKNRYTIRAIVFVILQMGPDV